MRGRHRHRRPEAPWVRGFGYVHARLHRRLFIWFGASILVTGLVVTSWSSLAARGTGQNGWGDLTGIRNFTSSQFSRVWDDPVQRDALAEDIGRDFNLNVTLRGPNGEVLKGVGALCSRGAFKAKVTSAFERGGTVSICPRGGPHGWRFFFPLTLAGAVLWAASGKLARRLTRPLEDLAHVAQELGAGRLSSRARLNCRQGDEVRVLASAMNDMAARIEKQIADQRELLAAVSHELRTPLGHIRLLVELAREGGAPPKHLNELDKEIVEIDSLVGELLAHSRLDFGTLTLTPLDPVELVHRALERAGRQNTPVSVEGPMVAIEADATLIARAMSNLVDNAVKHAGGLTLCRVAFRDGSIAFEVEDHGEGFASGEEMRAFDAFYRRPSSDRERSLGLGLNLVRRTAEAHGGTAYAQNLPPRGARVGFTLRARP